MTNGSQISVEQLKVASALTIGISRLSNYCTASSPQPPQEVSVALYRAVQAQTMHFQSGARSVSLVTERPITSTRPLLRRRARVFSPRVILGSDWRRMAGYCLVFRKSHNAGRSALGRSLVCVKCAPLLAREGGREAARLGLKRALVGGRLQ